MTVAELTLVKGMYRVTDSRETILKFINQIPNAKFENPLPEGKKPLIIVLFNNPNEVSGLYKSLVQKAVVFPSIKAIEKNGSGLIRYMNHDILFVLDTVHFDSVHLNNCDHIQTHRVIGVVGEMTKEFVEAPDFSTQEFILNKYLCSNHIVGGMVMRGNLPPVSQE